MFHAQADVYELDGLVVPIGVRHVHLAAHDWHDSGHEGATVKNHSIPVRRVPLEVHVICHPATPVASTSDADVFLT